MWVVELLQTNGRMRTYDASIEIMAEKMAAYDMFESWAAYLQTMTGCISSTLVPPNLKFDQQRASKPCAY